MESPTYITTVHQLINGKPSLFPLSPTFFPFRNTSKLSTFSPFLISLLPTEPTNLAPLFFILTNKNFQTFSSLPRIIQVTNPLFLFCVAFYKAKREVKLQLAWREEQLQLTADMLRLVFQVERTSCMGQSGMVAPTVRNSPCGLEAHHPDIGEGWR